MWKARKSVNEIDENGIAGTLELTASAHKVVQTIAKISKDTKTPLNQEQVNAVINLLEPAIIELIESGYRGMNISSILKLNIKEVPEKEFRNPKTQEPVLRPRGLKVFYKLSTPFLKKVFKDMDINVGEENKKAIIALFSKAKEARKGYKAKAEAKKANAETVTAE
jgi:nucleoid DNA-binding protein